MKTYNEYNTQINKINAQLDKLYELNEESKRLLYGIPDKKYDKNTNPFLGLSTVIYVKRIKSIIEEAFQKNGIVEKYFDYDSCTFKVDVNTLPDSCNPNLNSDLNRYIHEYKVLKDLENENTRKRAEVTSRFINSIRDDIKKKAIEDISEYLNCSSKEAEKYISSDGKILCGKIKMSPYSNNDFDSLIKLSFRVSDYFRYKEEFDKCNGKYDKILEVEKRTNMTQEALEDEIYQCSLLFRKHLAKEFQLKSGKSTFPKNYLEPYPPENDTYSAKETKRRRKLINSDPFENELGPLANIPLEKNDRKEKKQRERIKKERNRRSFHPSLDFKEIFTIIFKIISFPFRCIFKLFSLIGRFFTFLSHCNLKVIGISAAVVIAIGGIGVLIGTSVAKDNDLKNAHTHWCIFDAGVITKEPTCYEEGEYVYTCIRHNEKEVVKLPKTHRFNENNICDECGYKIEASSSIKYVKNDDNSINIINVDFVFESIEIPAYIENLPVKNVKITPFGCELTRHKTINIYTSPICETIWFGGQTYASREVSEQWDATYGYDWSNEWGKNYVEEINVIGDCKYAAMDDLYTLYCRINYLGNVENYTNHSYSKNINFIYDVKMLKLFDRNIYRSTAIKRNTQIYLENDEIDIVDVGNFYIEEGNPYYHIDDDYILDQNNNKIAKAAYRYKNIFSFDNYKLNNLLGL